MPVYPDSTENPGESAMPFTPHYNTTAGIWFDGQATIPPPGPPDTVENVQTLKPKIAFNEWQSDTFGNMFFVLIMPVEVYPKDKVTDPNGLGSTVQLPSIPSLYFYTIAIEPLYSAGDLIAWQCLCVRAYPT